VSFAAAVSALAAPFFGSPAAAQGNDAPFVAVTAIVRDAAVDALYTGMTDALRDAGYRDGESVRLRFESAETDAKRAAELVRSFARDRADIIVAITEPSVRIAATERLRVPLVIAGVGPATANELRRNRKARLLTGIVDGERFDTPLSLIREIAPDIRTVAVPISADAAVNETALRQMTAFARSIDLTVEQLPVSVKNGAIAATIKDYSPDETAILLDKRIFPGAPVERIIAAAEASNLLVFASDEDTVVRGALAAIITDPYGTGLQIGQLVARILKQPSAARTPLQSAEPSYIVINQDTAARAGIEIPGAVLARRGRVIGWADIAGPRPRGKPVVPEPPPPLSEEPKSGTANPRSKPPVQDR
jgi:putative ABC transport system substrate-binding protein